MNIVRDIIVIGAPIGGAAALIEVVSALPADLPAAVFIVLHSNPEKPILLADALSAPRRMRATEAMDGDPLEPHRIYVASDGKHLRVERDVVRVKHEPPENECCPSIDVLFRSAAETHKERVVAVTLLHVEREGSLGLHAVRQHGGRTITHRNEMMPDEPRHRESGETLAHHHLSWPRSRRALSITSKGKMAAANFATRASSGVSASLLVGMHDRLESTERALRDREVTFAALAKVAPVGIMRFDAEGRCNYINDRWTAITGLTIDRAIGDGWQRAIHPEDRPHVVHRWNLLRLQEEIFREEYRICRSDGSVRWVLAEGVPLRSYRGRLIGFIRTVTDITPHRELEEQVNAARVLETKESERERFSEDLHDGLGQYLTGILFRASALQRDLEAENSPHATDAAKIAELVNETITQTHDLARGIHPVPLRRDGLVLALQELQHKLCDPNVANCRFDCDEPIYLDDPARATHVYRIAQEAVTNAIKYSRASQITIALRQCKDGAELIVRDDGIGFDFNAPRAQGSGLGIMRHRARLIDGTLDIQSDANGTMITCRFPLSPNES